MHVCGLLNTIFNALLTNQGVIIAPPTGKKHYNNNYMQQ